jgi:Tfp pilus assembly protein PilF
MRRSVVFLAILLFCATGLLAQMNQNPYTNGTIQGEVELPNGQPLPDVYIKLEPENAGGLIQTATTDSAGHFAFAGQGIGAGGNYEISINVQGFEPVNKLVMLTGPSTYVPITLIPKPSKNGNVGGIVPAVTAAVPPRAVAQFQTGLRNLDQGKASEAERAFKKAIQIDPQYAASYLRLSEIYADQHHFPEAKRAIEQAVRIEKPSSESYGYLGYLYMMEKQPEKARKSFEKSLRMEPKNWFAQLELGRLRYEQKDYAAAYRHFLAARELHPQMATVHLMLYDDLIHLNKYKAALAELDAFVARFPKNPQAARMRKVRPALAAAAAKQH